MQLSPFPCHLVPLIRSKYSPQRPILKHPQPTTSLNVSEIIAGITSIKKVPTPIQQFCLHSFFGEWGRGILLSKVIQNSTNKRDLQDFHLSLQINIDGYHILECAWTFIQRLNQFMKT
jgi:hypothetical protein